MRNHLQVKKYQPNGQPHVSQAFRTLSSSKGQIRENYLAHYPWSLPSPSLLPGGAGNVGDLVLQPIHSTGNWRWRMCPLYSSLLLPDTSFLPKSSGLGTWAISLEPPKTTPLHFLKFFSLALSHCLQCNWRLGNVTVSGQRLCGCTLK